MADVYDVLGIKVTLDDAERLVRWFEAPEAKLFKSFLESQRDTFDEQSEREVGVNAIADVLNRERAISSRLAMKSILAFPSDLRDFIIDEKERIKKTLDK